MRTIEALAPGEDVGRDTISRFDMQFQAAAYAALEILEGNGVDCVYCDYHDDFVVRKKIGDHISYHFFQVKTKKKENDQYSLSEIFGLSKSGVKVDDERLKKVRSSFAAKLILHGIVFGETCSDVTLLSNVHFDDSVVKTVDELRGKAPKSKAATFLANNFSAIFLIESDSDIVPEIVLSKLSLKPAVRYIGKDRESFSDAARSAVHRYSEIDLTYHETKQLADGLVDLVYRKARTKLEGVPPDGIAALIGVQLDDLLSVLSISRSVYDALCAGEDERALKTASVIQRWYRRAEADEPMIDYAAQQKVSWDMWLRNARHIYTPFELATLLQRIDTLFELWQTRGGDFTVMHDLIKHFVAEPSLKTFAGLDEGLVFGAMNAVLVRKYSR
ncbi:dsDNA nuclease domain-containing protein [Paraburkholderia sp. MM6662-R1]|uniref:dsDNA nuclease domain-containing protein n=1 Tax=Paraburkholderia sp. MM6662-R1 TaxID=2991066 RepID=UPI003D1CFB30